MEVVTPKNGHVKYQETAEDVGILFRWVEKKWEDIGGDVGWLKLKEKAWNRVSMAFNTADQEKVKTILAKALGELAEQWRMPDSENVYRQVTTADSDEGKTLYLISVHDREITQQWRNLVRKPLAEKLKESFEASTPQESAEKKNERIITDQIRDDIIGDLVFEEVEEGEEIDWAIPNFFEPNRFLSNFTQCEVFYEGKTYNSVENAYQGYKFKDQAATLLMFKKAIEWIKESEKNSPLLEKLGNVFEDNPDLLWVFSDKRMNARDTKLLWNALREHADKERDQKKLGIIVELVYDKYARNLWLKKKLLATGEAHIYEWWLGKNNRYRWHPGMNIMGQITMLVRAELRTEEETK